MTPLFRFVRLAGGHGRNRGLAAVFVCYLDDSDAEKAAVLTLAGYIQRIADWEQFEDHAEKVYGDYNVSVLHAKELHGTKEAFKGWPYQKKTQFIVDLYSGCPRAFGISSSIRKERFQDHAKNAGIHSSSAYGSAFSAILTWFTMHPGLDPLLQSEGLSFVVESGHRNNGEVQELFHELKNRPALKGKLRSLTFSGKMESKAIQLADLLAFYSRRWAARMNAYTDNPTKEQARSCEDKLLSVINTVNRQHYMTITTKPFAKDISVAEYEQLLREGKPREGWKLVKMGSRNLNDL